MGPLHPAEDTPAPQTCDSPGSKVKTRPAIAANRVVGRGVRFFHIAACLFLFALAAPLARAQSEPNWGLGAALPPQPMPAAPFVLSMPIEAIGGDADPFCSIDFLAEA